MLLKGISCCWFLLALVNLSTAQITDTTAVRFINTPYDEHNLYVNYDCNVVAVSRAFHPDNIGGKSDKGDVWLAEKQSNGKFGMPQKIKSWNNKNWNGVIGLMPDNKTMLLHGHYQNPKSQGISVSKKVGNFWSEPKDIKIPYFVNKSDNQTASLSINGKVLVFSIESYGTVGGEDLYVSFFKNGNWTEPKNLGNVVNTKYQEMAPFLAPDNKTLYFASNGHAGFGSFDIYASQRLDESWRNWSQPENLGPFVNTSAREMSIVYNHEREVVNFISTKDSDGYGDLKYMSLAPTFEDDFEIVAVPTETNVTEIVANPDTTATAMVVVDSSAAPVEPIKTVDYSRNIKFVNAVNRNTVDVGFSFESADQKGTFNSENGMFEFSSQYLNYVKIKVDAKGFFMYEQKFDSLDLAELKELVCYLDPIEVGKTVRLEHVLFARGSTDLLEESFEDLNAVIHLLKNNPTMEIELAGHTDNLGNPHVNMKLSRERAESIKSYLVKNGVKKKRIVEKGYGGTKPIASNKNEETRKLNRRVEFTVLKFNQ